MQHWEQWIKINKPKLQHVADFEERFVREILTQIPEISPTDLIAQYPFQDFSGNNRYIDFCIKNDIKGYFTTIQLDGRGKDFTDTLERQNTIMVKNLGILLRFANVTWIKKPDIVIQTIRTVLQDQHKAHIEKLRTADVHKLLQEQKHELDKLKQSQATSIPQVIPVAVASEHDTRQSDKMTLFGGIMAMVVVIGLIIWGSTKTTLEAPTSTQNTSVGNTSIDTPPAEITESRPRIPDTVEAAMENADYLTDGAGGTPVSSSDAKNYVGHERIICGYIAEIKTVQGRTYLNMGSRYPDQEVTVVIWPDAADKVQSALDFGGKIMCIYGEITEYKGIPQISLRNLDQIIR